MKLAPLLQSLTLLRDRTLPFMNIREKNLILVLLSILLVIVKTNALNSSCNRSSPNPILGKHLPYPFGCSAGCEIQLNCSQAGIFIGEFPIQFINFETIRISLQSRCDRPLKTLRQLYSDHHAPTSHNAILLRNCTDDPGGSSSCMIPGFNVHANFQAPQNCSTNTSLTCYAEANTNAAFLEYDTVQNKGCKYLLSSMSAQILNSTTSQVVPSVTLDVEVAELRWWMPGVCNCDNHADCIPVLTPKGREGYRCNCTKGFVGDGFRDGFGCRKALNSKGFLKSRGLIDILIVSGLLVLVLIPVFGCWWLRKKRKTKDFSAADELGKARKHPDLQFFSLSTIIAATSNFHFQNKLGQGGFGSVYKGKLPSGQEIAVKRLSKSSRQGIEEFKNEVVLIERLQHRNLVKLLGCCIRGEERMLVLEYMPNKSLDSFLFDHTRKSLHWEKRFEIINGIARGILYLHQDSRDRIIHWDLKTSNVLLDAEMTPKISDFGMARIFYGDQLQDTTARIAGTYGYMAPEYAVFGRYSTKSDVFSFGIIILEIVSGKRNSGSYQEDHSMSLIGTVWQLWGEDRALEILDSSLELYQPDEVLRCIQVGLLCVQEDSKDRPTMSAAVFMLSGEASLSTPKQPAFVFRRSACSSAASFTNGLCSINDLTLTNVEARD